LRGRAARMEPIEDLTALRPVLASLKAKRLVIPLTPDGRGHVVSHALFQPHELDKLRSEFAAAGGRSVDFSPRSMASETEGAPSGIGTTGRESATHQRPEPLDHHGGATDWQRLRGEVAELRGQIVALQQAVEELTGEFQRRAAELDRLKDALGA
jgi:uncharacterized protein